MATAAGAGGGGAQGLTRKATWIDKSITLRSVLKDSRALKAFQDFATTVHAEENVAFWIAVEFFKVQHVSTPKTSSRVRKRFSQNLHNLKVEEEPAEGGALFRSDPRHSQLMDKILTPELIAQLDMTDHQKNMLQDAARIFTTFLEDGAPHWACVDTKAVDEIRTALKSGEAVDISIFNKAQAAVYVTMQTDTFPRFLKALIAAPEKFSSGERFEMPDDLREALKTVASRHELLTPEAAMEAAHSPDAASIFTSPRMSKRMPAVEE